MNSGKAKIERGTFNTLRVHFVILAGICIIRRGYFEITKGICKPDTGIVVSQEGIFT